MTKDNTYTYVNVKSGTVSECSQVGICQTNASWVSELLFPVGPSIAAFYNGQVNNSSESALYTAIRKKLYTASLRNAVYNFLFARNS